MNWINIQRQVFVVLHIQKINNSILIPEKEFLFLLEKIRKTESIEIEDDTFDDLVHASSTSFDFWDNPIDDEVWNNA